MQGEYTSEKKYTASVTWRTVFNLRFLEYFRRSANPCLLHLGNYVNTNPAKVSLSEPHCLIKCYGQLYYHYRVSVGATHSSVRSETTLPIFGGVVFCSDLVDTNPAEAGDVVHNSLSHLCHRVDSESV